MRTISYATLVLVPVLVLTACAEAGSTAPSPSPTPSLEAATTRSAASEEAADARAEPLRLVTLGDAYTHGTWTASPHRDGWPGQLVQLMRKASPRLRLVGNLADQSKTSQDVLVDQVPQVEQLQPDVVTLQVGSNDIGHPLVSPQDYRANVDAIILRLLELVPPEHIFLITTPDHTLTEVGSGMDAAEGQGSTAVATANAILSELAAKHRVNVVRISPVNALAASDPSLVIGRGPHPTAKQYTGWAELIGRTMQEVLAEAQP